MNEVKIVIGANYGDEGKGLMTDYFAYEAKTNGKSCIVVAHNGGAQRGHTVVTPNGKRHVFHHFGSGTFAGADTYLSSQYILNPMTFINECGELISLGYKPVVFVDKECRFSTPFDMIINQILEKERGENRHGSCGMGIWETIHRYTLPGYNLSFFEFMTLSIDEQFDYIKDIRDFHFYGRLMEYGIAVYTDDKYAEIRNIIENDNLIIHFIHDCHRMWNFVKMSNVDIILNYNTVIYESGQGLLLDECNPCQEHTTPSKTGCTYPCCDLLKVRSKIKGDIDVEVCYVTRSYMTRHGAGAMENERSFDSFMGFMKPDKTNIPNEFQGSLRYGTINWLKLFNRIADDFKIAKSLLKNTTYKLRNTIAVTHCDVCVDSYKCLYDDKFKYMSYSETRSGIAVNTNYNV